MAERYDSTQDVNDHITAVRKALGLLRTMLEMRALLHDASKLAEPEKSMFDEWVPNLKMAEYGSAQYQAALVGMGEGLKHHYEINRHHPEFFGKDGIAGMNLVDVTEMVCDWYASAKARNKPVNMQVNAERFGIPPVLVAIIENTLKDLERAQTVVSATEGGRE